jgi:L-ascorbate metabolism protein UlaG (beta-lactamase superfamily)
MLRATRAPSTIASMRNATDRLQRCAAILAVAALVMVRGVSAAGPAYVDITWMSISNMYYELGPLRIVTDGYISRLPEDAFFGGGGGYAQTRRSFRPDVAAVTRVMSALGGPSRVSLLLTGHSHWDHSFDTATWSRLTGARIIGSKTTCLQAQAQGIPAERCRTVSGGEAIALGDGVTLRVVRWNHSGDPAVNPEQHNPIELRSMPTPDPATGGLHAGVAEDFPNGGGNRAYLFTVDGADGRFSWFFNNSASAVDLHVPIVVDRVDYGAPLDNLKAAMADAKLTSVDLWIGSSAAPVAKLVVPILKPKAFIPVHWDGLFGAFASGVPKPYAAPDVEAVLAASGVTVVKPAQYMDKWRLDRRGVRPVANTEVKKALGFN